MLRFPIGVAALGLGLRPARRRPGPRRLRARVAAAAFVIATAPAAGSRSGERVRGGGLCSAQLREHGWSGGRDGTVLNEGVTVRRQSGRAGAGSAFRVTFAVAARQVGYLEVFEVDASDGEGFPPGRTVLPLVLQQPQARRGGFWLTRSRSTTYAVLHWSRSPQEEVHGYACRRPDTRAGLRHLAVGGLPGSADTEHWLAAVAAIAAEGGLTTKAAKPAARKPAVAKADAKKEPALAD